MNDANRIIKYAQETKEKAQMAIRITAELSEESSKNHERTKVNVRNTLNKYNRGV